MKYPVFWGLIVPALLRRLTPPWLLESPVALAARHPWRTLAFAGGALAIGGLAVSASGVIPIKASAGHWSLTERLLHFSMQQSIATHSFWIDAPPLDDPALVLRGAAHYDLGCRPCHGGVADDRPRIPQHMLPRPRDLTERVAHWRPRELFYIVKHGMKFTGMPAWPSQQRDDEVWAVVAFLTKMPELSRDLYRQLAGADRTGAGQWEADGAGSPPDIVREICSRCHGSDGRGRGAGAFPKLAGQRVDYLERALRAYAEGRRHSGIMAPVAANLTDESRHEVAQYYASLEDAPGEDMGSASAEGAEIATIGRPDRMIPACVECHGPGAVPKNPAYPKLTGQYADYLQLQLELLRARKRGGSEYVHLMHSFVDRLEPGQIVEVARYYASSSP